MSDSRRRARWRCCRCSGAARQRGSGARWSGPRDPRMPTRLMELTHEQFMREWQEAFGWRAGRALRAGHARPLSAGAVAQQRYRGAAHRAAGQCGAVAASGGGAGLQPGAARCGGAGRVAGRRRTRVRDDAARTACWRTSPRRAQPIAMAWSRFTDTLVRAFSSEHPAGAAARDAGLLLFDLLPPAKRALSRVSLGFGARTPRLARGRSLAGRELPMNARYRGRDRRRRHSRCRAGAAAGAARAHRRRHASCCWNAIRRVPPPSGAPFDLRVSAISPAQPRAAAWSWAPGSAWIRRASAHYERMVVWHESTPPDSPDVLRFDAAEAGRAGPGQHRREPRAAGRAAAALCRHGRRSPAA